MRILLAVVFIVTTMLLIRRYPKTLSPIIFAYIIGIVYLTFLIREPRTIYRFMLSPFSAAKEAIELGGSWIFAGIRVVKPELLEGIILNILLFIPFGYLLPLVFKKADQCWKVMLIGLFVSLFIEAMQLVYPNALCTVNGIHLSAQELIEIAFLAEKEYVGVNVGTLDQSCEVLSKKDHLLYLDCRDNGYELIPVSKNMPPYKIAVFFSGLEHNIAGSKFNMRVDELRAGIYALQAFAGYEYGKFQQANARDVEWEVYQQYKDRLPRNWRLRCEHWYTEFQRVEAGAEAWRRGDLQEYGRLSFESGWSSIHNWESGAPEQIRLYEIMRETSGIYGGRFSGAGFKGCCMALVDPQKTDLIAEEVERKYLAAFPDMKGKYSFYLCESADGVEIL